jgi:SAM-dependent methyltransferase
MQRQPHAALHVPGRITKAEKIQHLLGLRESLPRARRLLEIGTGSGAIAHHFATSPDLRLEVEAVDVVDQRQIRDGYGFRCVEGVVLPFADQSFDLVISNHVLEHVGTSDDQQRHLAEIARVLRPGGVAYLASPNRWQAVEPHYHLLFLSWIPRAWRTPYLRLSGKGRHYDCEPLRMGDLEKMVTAAGLEGRNICLAATRYMFDVEKPSAPIAAWVRRIPDAWLQALRRLSPTHVYLLRHKGEAA